MRRLVLAFLLSPAAILLIALAISALRGHYEAVHVTVIIGAILYAVTFVVGVPGVLLFRYLGWNRWWQVALVGAAVGFVFTEGPRLLAAAITRPLDVLALVLPFTLIGLACASLFWLIGIWRNPWFLRVTETETRVGTCDESGS